MSAKEWREGKARNGNNHQSQVTAGLEQCSEGERCSAAPPICSALSSVRLSASYRMIASQLVHARNARRTLGRSAQYVTKRHYGASGKRVHVETHDFFKAVPKLVEKRKSANGLHYVFLEGLAGSGKSELLDRLQRVRRAVSPTRAPHFCTFRASTRV